MDEKDEGEEDLETKELVLSRLLLLLMIVSLYDIFIPSGAGNSEHRLEDISHKIPTI